MTELVLPGEWVSDALCAEVGGDGWFPEKGMTARQAKEVCDRCPVEAACLAYALDNEVRFGIWGGLSERQRELLPHRPRTRECATPDCLVLIPRVTNKLFCGPCAKARHRRAA